jgi:DNA polymerase
MTHLSIDIETFSSVDLKKAGLYKYVQAPDFQILLFAYSFDGEPVRVIDLAQGECLPDEVISALHNSDVVKHAYNAPFEWYCLNEFYLSPLEQWHCTMLHGLYCGYTAGLAATAVALGLPENKRKISTGSALIRTFCLPCKPTKSNGHRTRTLPHHEPDKWQLFKEYCRQDVVTEMEIERRLSAFPVPAAEQTLWELDQRINAYGVAVNQELIAGALYCDEVITNELMTEAVHLSGLDNPKSVQQLSKWLTEEMGEEITNLRKDTVKELIKATNDGTAKRMLEIRQELSKTSVKKYTAMDAAVCADGRIRGLLQFYGANRTGRWAGRLVQVQNLPRNYLETLGHARECTRLKKIDALKLIYGNVPDTLSQLTRTAFVPSPGNTLLVADFSAIEARIIAWLAGEQWRLDVFATHGKIYEASASQMFGVPLEKIVKGNPEYELRQKGKVAELALGYQGAAGALISMGALNMGLTEEELPEIVQRWRSANKRIVDLWYSLENAVLNVMRTGLPTGIKGLLIAREGDYATDQDFLTITLPSGRKLFYAKPFLEINERNREALYYRGVNQQTRKWEIIPTYGGKLVENCLAEDTEVLTHRGWVQMHKIQSDDLLWDGNEWVTHEGLVCKGQQNTISVNGVRLTPEHLILTEKGWRDASSCEGYYRHEVTLPNGSSLRGIRREKVFLDLPLRLWKRIRHACRRISKGKTKILWLPKICGYLKSTNYPWNVKTSCLCSLAVHERPLYSSDTPGMGELRRTRYQSVRSVAKQFRSVLGGYEPHLQTGTVNRSKRCRWQLLPGKLPLGIRQNPRKKQTQQLTNQYSLGESDFGGSSREVRNRGYNSILSRTKQLPRKPFILSSGRYESIYDILNTGPRNRFTVMGDDGPFIVHNCVQAIARDCLAESLSRVATAGYLIVMHVHDEIVLDVSESLADLNQVCEIMSRPIHWAPGLLLKADGFTTKFYKKD